MHPNDRDPAMGVILGVAIGGPIMCGLLMLAATFLDDALYYMAWSVVVLAEAAR
jgi:hypothetical protein